MPIRRRGNGHSGDFSGPSNRFSALDQFTPPDAAERYIDPEGFRYEGLPKHIPQYYPEIYPIPDAQEFNPSGSILTNVVETGFIPLAPTQEGLAGTIFIPKGNAAVIRGFTITVTDMTVLTDVRFTLLVNSGPAGGYGDISIIPRTTLFAGNSFDCLIRVPQDSRIQVQFSNVDGGAYRVGASVSGWYWPIESGKRWLEKGY